MSERKESSVLFSLRELQTIEEERVSEEAQSAIQAAENIRLAKEAEVQAVRDAEEARRQATELAERQARDEVERKQREEQMRLEDSERRARVDAQAMIEQQRMAKEMELKVMEAKRKKPAWIIAAVVAIVLVAGGALFLKNQSDNRAAAKEAEQVQRLAIEATKKEARVLAANIEALQIESEQNDKAIAAAVEAIQNAENETAAAKAKADLKRAKDVKVALIAKRAAAAKAAAKAKKRAERKKYNKCANSSDPLCGI